MLNLFFLKTNSVFAYICSLFITELLIMKKLLFYFILVALFTSCVKEESVHRNCISAEYNKVFEFKLSEEVCFPDGNTIVLENIEHQLCPCEMVCAWEGDLYITLTGYIGSESKEKQFYPSRYEINAEILESHEITSASYRYGENGDEVPPCAEDFEPEKVTLVMSISPF